MEAEGAPGGIEILDALRQAGLVNYWVSVKGNRLFYQDTGRPESYVIWLRNALTDADLIVEQEQHVGDSHTFIIGYNRER